MLCYGIVLCARGGREGGSGTVKRLPRCSIRDTVSYPLSGGRDQVNIGKEFIFRALLDVLTLLTTVPCYYKYRDISVSVYICCFFCFCFCCCWPICPRKKKVPTDVFHSSILPFLFSFHSFFQKSPAAAAALPFGSADERSGFQVSRSMHAVQRTWLCYNLSNRSVIRFLIHNIQHEHDLGNPGSQIRAVPLCDNTYTI